MTNDSTQIQNAADELDKYAGEIAWRYEGEVVKTLGDIAVGDRVAKGQGRGRQGIVQEVQREGGTGKNPCNTHGINEVVIAYGGGTQGYHSIHAEAENYNDDAARFGGPGYQDASGNGHRVHKLVVIERGVVEVDEDDYDPHAHVETVKWDAARGVHDEENEENDDEDEEDESEEEKQRGSEDAPDDEQELEAGEKVNVVGDQSHKNLGTQWEVLTRTDDGYLLTDEAGIDTLRVRADEVEAVM